MSDPALPYIQGPCSPYVDDSDIDDTEICRVASGETGGITPSALTLLRAAATDIVWVLLGRPNIGTCEVTIHPCSRDHGWRWWSGDGHYNGGYGAYGGCNGCGEDGAILLDAPVIDVGDVVIDAEVLDTTEYYLLNGVWLVRSNGRWPAGSVGDDYADFSITYSFGEPISQLVRDAAVEVLVDLYNTRPGLGGVFPRAASSVSRQGVSFSLESEANRAQRMGMALPALSKAIAVYNPYQEPHQPMAWSPDAGHRSRAIRTF